MPRYNFKCAECEDAAPITVTLSIPDFFDAKGDKMECEMCCKKTMVHQIVKVNSVVEKSKDQILSESEEDIRKTVDRVLSGDKETIRDIYGEDVNQPRTNGSF